MLSVRSADKDGKKLKWKIEITHHLCHRHHEVQFQSVCLKAQGGYLLRPPTLHYVIHHPKPL